MDLLLHSTIPQMSAGDQAWLPLVRHAILSSLELPYFPFLLKPYFSNASRSYPAANSPRANLRVPCVSRLLFFCSRFNIMRNLRALVAERGLTIDNERATTAR